LARINIEDSIFKDQRFIDLCILCGDSNTALGQLVFVWINAQKYFNSHGEIPNEAWVTQKLSENVIKVKLAERSSTGVRVCGQKEQFAWIKQASDAGKKSAESRKKTNGSSQPKRRTPVRETAEGPSRPVEGSCTSYSYSNSYSNSISGSSLVSEGGAKAPPPRSHNAPNELNLKTWEAYSLAYFSRYHSEPVRNATVNSQIANLVKRLGHEAPDVVKFYLEQNRAFYIQSCHPVGLCLKDAEALRTQWVNGSGILPIAARQAEQRTHNSDVWDRAFDAFEKQKAGEKL